METKYNLKNCEIVDNDLNYINCSGVANSKKVKNALRQQVKRRRKNTTIAAGNPHLVNKIVNALPSNVSSDFSSSGMSNPIAIEETAVTMEEVLSSLPGFGIKSNKRRSIKRLSVAAQLEAGLVDLESPASILAYTSLRALLNRHTFQGLPLLYQRKLAQLLPAVDRQDAATSGLNNEFFARACQEWRKRLSEGEFTPENQHRLKLEAEKDKSKLDPWKLKHFEPIWEEKRELFMIQCGLHSLNSEQKFSSSLTSLSKLRSSSESNLDRNLTDFPSDVTDDSLIKTKTEKLDLSIPRNSFDKSHSTSVSDHDIPKFDFTDRILDAAEDDENEEKVHVDHAVEDNDEDEVHDDEDDSEDDGDENDNDIEDLSDEDSNDEIEDNEDSDGEISDDNNDDNNTNKYGNKSHRNYNTRIGDENDVDDYDTSNYHDDFDGNYYHETDDYENYEDENDHDENDEEADDDNDHDDEEDGEDDDQYDDNVDDDDNNTEEDDCHEKTDSNKKDFVSTSRVNKRSHDNDDTSTVNKQLKARISVVHFDEEAQHCKAIMINNCKTSRHNKRPFFKLPFIEKIADGPDNRKKMKISVEEKEESKKENTDKTCSSPSNQSKYSCNTAIEEFSLKTAETFTFDNQNQLDLEYQDSDVDPKDSINSKLKFGTKDKFISNDIEMDIDTEKEKIISSEDLDCEQREILNQLDSEADNNLTSELSEVIEIDHETLQRIHDLEVQGEMQVAYEEISHCSEEIYPIDIGIISSDIKISEKSDEVSIDQDQKINNCVSAKSQEEAFQEANNYVCSEMLENDWTSSKKESEVSNDKEELVHWPFAPGDVGALTGVNEMNVAVSTSDNHEESGLIVTKKSISSDDNEENFENSSCFTVPATNLNSEPIQITTPVTSCLMKNMQSTQSSSIITIPQLQAIRFVQTNFQTTVERSAPDTTSKDSSVCTYIQSTSNTTQNQSCISSNLIQNKVCGNQEDIYNELNEDNESQNQTQNIISESLIQQNMQTQSTVLFQQQALLTTPLSRQLIAPIKSQQQSYYPLVMNVASKTNRCMGTQSNNRSSRISNREQNSSRSRNVPKEPLGAVNLERSYQICQAVIASSPNRDQLKAHLKPPPGLLIKEKSSSNNKPIAPAPSSSTAQRNWNSNQDEGTQNKSQGVMLQQIITTARQNCSEESLENNPALKGSRSNFEDFEQYVVVNRVEANDSIPRASSAPPMPPHIDNASIIHMVHGRPASAGEKPHQAIASKKKDNHLKSNKLALNNSNIIHEDDLSYLCRCNIRQAMMVCRRCGAFCHDDCITPQFLCAICLLN